MYSFLRTHIRTFIRTNLWRVSDQHNAWPAACANRYKANVQEAVKAYWGFSVQQAAVEESVLRTERVLHTSGYDRGAAGEIMITVRRQKDDLIRHYLKPQRDQVQAYLRKTAEEILNIAYQGIDDDRYPVVYAELMGERERQVQVQIGSQLCTVTWSGPYCSAEHADGYVIGAFGRPEAVKLTLPAPDGGRPKLVATLPAAGWDVRRRMPRVGFDAMLTIEDQSEDAPLLDAIPAAMRQRYDGRMTYASGAEYAGSWSHGRRQGVGCLIDVDGSRYVGEWVNDQQHGRGTYHSSDASRFVYHGTFFEGKKHGQGQIVIPATAEGGNDVTVNGTWEHDVFVFTGPATHQAAWESVGKLPSVLRQSWRGVDIACVPCLV